MIVTTLYPNPQKKESDVSVEQGQTIAVWFSCGAASAVAAKLTLLEYGNIANIHILNNPVVEEHADNLRFLKDCESWFGQKIETVINPSATHCSAEQIWEDRNYMSGVKGAPCTMILKREARMKWEHKNEVDWHVLGFTADKKEVARHDNFVTTQRNNVIPVLIEGGVTKGQCYQIIKDAGIEVPEIYKLGYPNANCIGCVKATGISYWQLVRKKHPEIFKKRAEQSRTIGAKLVKFRGKRIFLDELPLNAKGNKIKDMDFECGIFCNKN